MSRARRLSISNSSSLAREACPGGAPSRGACRIDILNDHMLTIYQRDARDCEVVMDAVRCVTDADLAIENEHERVCNRIVPYVSLIKDRMQGRAGRSM